MGTPIPIWTPGRDEALWQFVLNHKKVDTCKNLTEESGCILSDETWRLAETLNVTHFTWQQMKERLAHLLDRPHSGWAPPKEVLEKLGKLPESSPSNPSNPPGDVSFDSDTNPNPGSSSVWSWDDSRSNTPTGTPNESKTTLEIQSPQRKRRKAAINMTRYWVEDMNPSKKEKGLKQCTSASSQAITLEESSTDASEKCRQEQELKLEMPPPSDLNFQDVSPVVEEEVSKKSSEPANVKGNVPKCFSRKLAKKLHTRVTQPVLQKSKLRSKKTELRAGAQRNHICVSANVDPVTLARYCAVCAGQCTPKTKNKVRRWRCYTFPCRRWMDYCSPEQEDAWLSMQSTANPRNKEKMVETIEMKEEPKFETSIVVEKEIEAPPVAPNLGDQIMRTCKLCDSVVRRPHIMQRIYNWKCLDSSCKYEGAEVSSSDFVPKTETDFVPKTGTINTPNQVDIIDVIDTNSENGDDFWRANHLGGSRPSCTKCGKLMMPRVCDGCYRWRCVSKVCRNYKRNPHPDIQPIFERVGKLCPFCKQITMKTATIRSTVDFYYKWRCTYPPCKKWGPLVVPEELNIQTPKKYRMTCKKCLHGGMMKPVLVDYVKSKKWKWRCTHHLCRNITNELTEQEMKIWQSCVEYRAQDIEVENEIEENTKLNLIRRSSSGLPVEFEEQLILMIRNLTSGGFVVPKSLLLLFVNRFVNDYRLVVDNKSINDDWIGKLLEKHRIILNNEISEEQEKVVRCIQNEMNC